MNRKNLRHGYARQNNVSKIYDAWRGMLKRAYFKYPKYMPHYENIGVYKRWLKFENFLVDMGQPPSSKHQLDRINNKKGYSAKNCRWATISEQARNRKSNKKLRYKGKTKLLVEWADTLNLNRTTISQRLKRGWTVEKALSMPVNITKRNFRYAHKV